MPWKTIRHIFDELRKDLYIIEKHGDKFIYGEIRIKNYPHYLDELKYSIYEAYREYGLQTSDKNRVDQTLIGSQRKLSDNFSRNFLIRIEEWDGKSPLFYIPKGQRIKYEYKDDFSKVVFELALTARDIYNYLDSLKNNPRNSSLHYNNRKPRKRATRKDFKVLKELTEEKFQELYKIMIEDGYIENTSFKNFRNIFTGRPFDETLIWKLNNIYLNHFIKGIEGEGIKKLNDGKWEVICELFKDKNGKEFKVSQLREPGSTTTEDEMDSIEYLIEEFNNIVTS